MEMARVGSKRAISVKKKNRKKTQPKNDDHDALTFRGFG
jgi:hypothetical protein